ncbi:lectin C-type domain protein, partial [Oesophagostomum dentatum]
MMIGEVTKGKWLSADCDYMRVGFVCQIARKELCGDYREYAEGRRCYKKIDQPLSQDDAERYCQNECGHLASIHDAKESDIVHGLFNRENSYARIGLTYSDGNYSWSDNSTFDYNK